MKLLVRALFLLKVFSAIGQGSIQTDRPGQTETPSTTQIRSFQLELGIVHATDRENRSTQYELPATLWKYGITKKAEIRVNTVIASEIYPDSSTVGLQPLIIGAKLQLCNEAGVRPKTSILLQCLFPKLASRNFKSEHIGPDIRLLFQNSISDCLSLGYNIGCLWDGVSPKIQYAYTLSPSFKISKDFRGFVETYGFIKTAAHPEHWMDGGLMLQLSNDIQLDISAGYEFTPSVNHKHNTFESIGISVRI